MGTTSVCGAGWWPIICFLWLPQALRPGELVCPVQAPGNTSLESFLRVECNVSDVGNNTCICSAGFLSGFSWVMITADMSKKMNRTAGPGQWYFTDPSGRCVLVSDLRVRLDPWPCPPGFYCEGGSTPPRLCYNGDHCPGGTNKTRCPSGYFCPFPASPVQKCPDGGVCKEGSTMPDVCKAGFFCQKGVAIRCPKGHYCPWASMEPMRCSFMSICNGGRAAPGRQATAAITIIVSWCITFAVVQLYERMADREACVLLAIAVAVASLWAISLEIGIFVSLLFFVIGGNWAVLKVSCSAVSVSVPTCFALISTVLLQIVIWIMDPPWALLVTGLLLASTICWLMSRDNFCFVFLGRVLLICAFAGLAIISIHIDHIFSLTVVTGEVICFIGLVTAWCCQLSRRKKEQFKRRLGGILPDNARTPQVNTLGTSPTATSADPIARTGLLSSEAPAESPTSMLPLGLDSVSSPSSASASFVLEDISFDLPDGTRLLQSLNLNIEAGKRVAVMGPSGSGKSTLLAVLSGRASYGEVSGTLRVSGRKVTDVRFLRSVTGYVPQDDILHGELTVKENIRFQAALRLPAGTPSHTITELATNVASELNLGRILNARVGTPEKRGVSGGQRKRVSIGMELVTQPSLLFADEPTSGLDSTTSYEVINRLNTAAANLGTTVLAVIHQPRYDTLCLFDDLVLLSVGGFLAYAGPTRAAIDYFRDNFMIQVPKDTNPADVMLDVIQAENFDVHQAAERYRRIRTISLDNANMTQNQVSRRSRPPFFKSLLVYMERAMLQMIRSYRALLLHQALIIFAVIILCNVMPSQRLDGFMAQLSFAALFLMLLEGVCGQRTFGPDLLVTMRESQVGMPMVTYFCAKDIVALGEVTMAAAAFAASYATFSETHVSITTLFSAAWAFVYCVYGISYMLSIFLTSGAAEMSAVVVAFLSFCTSGVNTPQLPWIATLFNGRGWVIAALSPIYWFWAYLLTAEVKGLSAGSLQLLGGSLRSKGYDVDKLQSCAGFGFEHPPYKALLQKWLDNCGWVGSLGHLLLLGVLFRYFALVCLLLYLHGKSSGVSRFLGTSQYGPWSLTNITGIFLKILIGSFVAVFLLAEAWMFGMIHLPHFRWFPGIK